MTGSGGLAPGSGERVHVEVGRGPLAAVPIAVKQELVRAHGCVVLRGFEVDGDGFRAVAGELGRGHYNMALDPRIRELVSADGVVAGVLKGTGALPLHMERGYSPLKPELVLFHVVRPSAVGGESLLCSGARALAALEAAAPATAARLRRARLLYRHTWEPEAWQGRYGADPAEVMARLGGRADIVELGFAGELLQYAYVAPAIVRSRLGGGDGLVNNVEGAWEVQHAAPGARRAAHAHAVMFEDGAPMTQAIVDEIHAAVASATEAHALAAGDVVAIDNYRFMHGRRAFEGPRVMHTIMADAAF